MFDRILNTKVWKFEHQMWNLLNLKFVIQVIQFVHESLDYFPHICNFLEKKIGFTNISIRQSNFKWPISKLGEYHLRKN